MQKLFIINYNNKKFRIFIDGKKRKTFLEIDKNGEYDYPSLEDFTYLHNIYNNYNYFNCYDIRDYFYKEKVRIASGLLSVVVALNSIPGVMAKSNIEVTNEGVSISENKEVVVSIKDSKALDSLLGSLNPKKEEVKKAIEDNPNLSSYVKIILNNILDLMVNLDKEVDLRVFYHNIKTLRVNGLWEDAYNYKYQNNSFGVYISPSNTVDYKLGYESGLLYHELWHAVNNLYLEKDGVIYTNVSKDVFLTEAFTNKYVGYLQNMEYSYSFEARIIDYLLTLTNYSFGDYNHKGADYFKELLKKEYPDINIDYIIDWLNTYNISGIFLDKKNIQDLNDFRDELFKYALNKIDINSKDIYAPFKDYIKTLGNIDSLYSYLDKYNQELSKRGARDLITSNSFKKMIEPFKDINGFVYLEGEVKPFKEDLTNYWGKIERDDFFNLIAIESFSNIDNINTKEFWESLGKDYNIINDSNYKETKLYFGDKLIIKDYIPNFSLSIIKDEKDNIGFRLYNKIGEVVYSSFNKIEIESNSINLERYLELNQFKGDSLKLEEVFNRDYLFNFLVSYRNVFKNIHISNNNIIIEPMYTFDYFHDNTQETYLVSDCFLDKNSNLIKPFNIPFIVNINNNIDLLDILKYYNLIGDNIEVKFNTDDLIDIFDNYIKDNKSLTR